MGINRMEQLDAYVRNQMIPELCEDDAIGNFTHKMIMRSRGLPEQKRSKVPPIHEITVIPVWDPKNDFPRGRNEDELEAILENVPEPTAKTKEWVYIALKLLDHWRDCYQQVAVDYVEIAEFLFAKYPDEIQHEFDFSQMQIFHSQPTADGRLPHVLLQKAVEKVAAAHAARKAKTAKRAQNRAVFFKLVNEKIAAGLSENSACSLIWNQIKTAQAQGKRTPFSRCRDIESFKKSYRRNRGLK